MTQQQKHPALVGHRSLSVRKTSVNMTTVWPAVFTAYKWFYLRRHAVPPEAMYNLPFLPFVRSYSLFSSTRMNEAGLTAAVGDLAHLTASDCIRDEFACRLRTNTCYCQLLVICIPLTLNLLIKVITVPPHFLVYISLLLCTHRCVVVLPQSDRHKPARFRMRMFVTFLSAFCAKSPSEIE